MGPLSDMSLWKVSSLVSEVQNSKDLGPSYLVARPVTAHVPSRRMSKELRPRCSSRVFPRGTSRS